MLDKISLLTLWDFANAALSTFKVPNLTINLFFSLATIFGISKLCNLIFNKKVGKITFLVLFFYPIFFGHMGFNGKDTILAFSHVWITYLAIDYLRIQEIKEKSWCISKSKN